MRNNSVFFRNGVFLRNNLRLFDATLKKLFQALSLSGTIIALMRIRERGREGESEREPHPFSSTFLPLKCIL
jgi:hypothetical protein